jgi:hypothetical protein
MAVLGAVLAALGWLAGRRGADAGPVEYDVGLPDTAAMWTGYTGPGFALAPSGDFIVYHAAPDGRSELWYRSLRDATVRRIPGTEDGSEPALSPDDTHVAFLRATAGVQSLLILPVEGGTAATLGRSTGPASLQWLPDGRILMIDNGFLRAQWFDPAGRPDPDGEHRVLLRRTPRPGRGCLALRQCDPDLRLPREAGRPSRDASAPTSSSWKGGTWCTSPSPATCSPPPST